METVSICWLTGRRWWFLHPGRSDSWRCLQPPTTAEKNRTSGSGSHPKHKVLTHNTWVWLEMQTINLQLILFGLQFMNRANLQLIGDSYRILVRRPGIFLLLTIFMFLLILNPVLHTQVFWDYFLSVDFLWRIWWQKNGGMTQKNGKMMEKSKTPIILRPVDALYGAKLQLQHHPQNEIIRTCFIYL